MENDKLDRMAIALCIAMIMAWFCFCLCSCSTQYVPVETVRYDSVFFAKIQKDSIFVRDSVFIRQKGDTVFKDKFKLVYKYVLLRDTMMTIKTDSIPVPIPVEKKRTWWEQTKTDIAHTAVSLVAIVILYLLMKWMVKRTRKE